MKKAYSYIRMSSDKQLRGDSLRRQLKLSEEYAKEFNLELVDAIDGIPLKDLGVSAFNGYNSSKGVLSLFLNALQMGKIPKHSVLLIESLDRLSRDDISNALTQFLTIINLNIEIVTLADKQSYTKETLNSNPSQMYISLGVMFRANEESVTKSKRISAAWENKRSNAHKKPITRIAPAWLQYSEINEAFSVIPDRAEIIKLIFEMCTNTCGLWAITKYLNANDVPRFGKAKIWHKSYVSKILSNRATFGEFQAHKLVSGDRVSDGEPIKGYFPAVITESEFLLAHASISNRSINNKGRKGITFSNLFSSLAFCGICGSAMIVRNRGELPKGGKTFVCSKKRNGGDCNMPSWRQADVENLVFKHLHEVNFSEILGTNNQEAELESSIQIFETKIGELDNQIQRGFDSLINGVLSDVNKRALEAKVNELQASLEEISRKKTESKISLENLREQSKGFSEEDIKNITKLLTEKVDDYYFRSSLHNTLNKFIKIFEFIVDDAFYSPWEIEKDNEILLKFKESNHKYIEYEHERLIDSQNFKDYYLQHRRRIKVVYKSGAIRHIMFGHDHSLLTVNRNSKPKN